MMRRQEFEDENTLVARDVKIELADLGEGRSGDYDELDPNDVPFLRFSVSRRENGRWDPVEDASYCTRLPVSLKAYEKHQILHELMNQLYHPVRRGDSVKKLCEKLSRIESPKGLGDPEFKEKVFKTIEEAWTTEVFPRSLDMAMEHTSGDSLADFIRIELEEAVDWDKAPEEVVCDVVRTLAGAAKDIGTAMAAVIMNCMPT